MPAPPAALAGAGVVRALHRIVLAELNAAGPVNWTRARVDASHVRVKRRPDGFVKRR